MFIVTREYLKTYWLPANHTQKIIESIGVWRWSGIYKYKDLIIPIVFNGVGIDLGGAAAMLNKDAAIVDITDTDISGRKVGYSSLKDIDFKADFVFSSHTLEHFYDLEGAVKDIHSVLKKGGKLILNLPSYKNVRWRAGIHTGETPHLHTFCMGDIDEDIINLVSIDRLIGKYFKIELAEYVDDCIIIMAEK